MNVKERNEINMKKKKEFKKNCKKANASGFNCRWNWENIGNNIGQLIIYDYNGDPVSIWKESREQLQALIDEWGFRENQYLAIGITQFHTIIGVGYGVYTIAWMDKNNMFQSIYFEENEVQLSISSEQAELDELRELDELDVSEFDPS